MALLWDSGAVLNLASGVLMATLGAGLLLANPRKDWNRVFALFAVFWGAQIVTANAVRVTTDPAAARLAGELSLAFLQPLYFFLVVFAGIFPRPRPPFGTSAWGVALLALPAGLALAMLFAAPTSLIAEVYPLPDGTLSFRWGPLFPFLGTAPFFGAMFYAVHAMTQRLGEAPSPTEHTQVALVLAALALFVGYVTPSELVRFAGAALGLRPAPEASGPEAAVIAGIMAVGMVLLARVVWRLWPAARGEVGGRARDARLVLRALLVAAAASVALELLAQAGGPRVEALGLFRAGSVALIAYGIVRYQLFDIDVRVKDAAAPAAALVAGITLAGAAWVAAQQAALPASLGGVAVAVAGIVAFVPVLRVANRLVDRVAPEVSREGDHLYLRKLEVYRASVDAVLAEGKAPRPDDPALSDLRGHLGLTERDHGVVVSLAVHRAEPARAVELRPGAVVFGKYAIDTLLGEGGFGRVFLARDRVLGRAVVIKELQARWRGNTAVVQRFLREAQVAGRLNHPNIVSVYEVEQSGQDAYVVMEYVPGGTLQDRLAAAPLPVAEAVRIGRATLAALEAAHGQGVVHRDVKPANILLGHAGEVKLADFGIAQLGEEDVQRTISGLTTAHGPVGTLQYMSPEQARGKPVDLRSDLYAVGAVLYRMLVGKPHLELAGKDEFDARNAIASSQAPAPLPGLPADLNAALARALAPDPADRFADARAFSEALAQVTAAPRRGPRPA